MLPLSNVSIRRRIRLLIANHSWVKFIVSPTAFTIAQHCWINLSWP